MLSHKKHKMLSRLIAFTFAFNAIAPVVFASENTTTATTTATTTTTSSSGLSLNSINNDILNRIASNASSTFKNRNLNISDAEINNLLNIPLSTTEEESYLTQEEKDYNALQLLIAQGYTSKEKRQKALEAIEEVEKATAKDSSVGGLSEAEKYMKNLLENFEDIESRAKISSGISSAITPTDKSMIAYKTILKIAKAERLACRNDANAAKAKADKGETLDEGTNTDPDKCKLSDRGKEAAQMLTAISNQQVNQTTDSKKTTTATESTTITTGERKCEISGTTVAINDNTKCCPTQQPFYNSTTAKCVASLSTNTTSNNNNKDDDDDDDDISALMAMLITGQQNKNNSDKKNSDKNNSTDITSSGNQEAQRPDYQNTTRIKKDSANSLFWRKNSNKIIMSRISDIKVEFNENIVDKDGKHIHINQDDTEFKMTVYLEESKLSKLSNNDSEQQQPLRVNIKARQYIGTDEDKDSTSSPYEFTYKNIESGQAVTLVYPTSMTPTSDGRHFLKVPKDDYVAQVTITDGENESAPFYIYYKVVAVSNKNIDSNEDQTTTKISILDSQGKNYHTTEIGYAKLSVSGTKFEDGICKVSVSGKMVPDIAPDAPQDVSQYNMTSLNEADCAKLNEDAKTKEVILVSNNASHIDEDSDGRVILESYDSNHIPAFIVNGEEQDTTSYLPSSVGDETIPFDREESLRRFGTDGIFLGTTAHGSYISLSGNTLAMNNNPASDEIYREFFNDSNVSSDNSVSIDYDENGKAISISAIDSEGNTVATRTIDDINEKTYWMLKKRPLTTNVINDAKKKVEDSLESASRIIDPVNIHRVGDATEDVANKRYSEVKDTKSQSVSTITPLPNIDINKDGVSINTQNGKVTLSKDIVQKAWEETRKAIMNTLKKNNTKSS